MVSALAAQLAQVRAQSTNSHDLKAQKRAHSQSLLFDAHVAASQDFDSIFHICFEGFEELCHVDSRFTSFSNNIFSEQSKHEDRTQMNEVQNQQLDAVVEEFLALVGSRLLLKPALKATEWLIRRFRAHEHNVVHVVFTFLPYHSTPLFLTLLSILPEKIPPSLKFLHPCIQSLANPPCHTIVHAASNNRPLLSGFSRYVLKVNRLGYANPALTSLWASVATQSVALMLGQSQSARRQSIRESQEDTILFLLPILSEGFAISGMSELRVACYMILTVLAAKTALGDEVLTTMMEAVTNEWTQTSHAGLICLSVLAQQRSNIRLSKRVFKAVISSETLEADLTTLKKQYRVDKLVVGLINGILQGLQRSQGAGRLHLVRRLMEGGFLDASSTTEATKSLILAAQDRIPHHELPLDAQDHLADLVLRLAESNTIGSPVQAAIQASELMKGQLKTRFQKITYLDEKDSDRMVEDAPIESSTSPTINVDFDSLTAKIPTKTAFEISFLSHSDSYVYGSLANAFCEISSSHADVEKFSELAVLRKSLGMSEPLFMSFYIRLWCGNGPVNARAAAIRTISRYLEGITLTSDVQILFPYLIHALGDQYSEVRRAASGLVILLARLYAILEDARPTNLPILGQEQIYGSTEETEAVSWLSQCDSHRLIADVLVPNLEECILDGDYILPLLSGILNGSKHNRNPKIMSKDLKMSPRSAIFSNLCSHVVNSPLYALKNRLLKTLNHVTKIGSTSRKKLLLPLLSAYASHTEDEHQRICRRDEVDPSKLLENLVGVVATSDPDGLQPLRNIIDPKRYPQFPSLRAAGLSRVQKIWSSMKLDSQLDFTRSLLEQAIGKTPLGANRSQDVDALEILRKLSLTTNVLLTLIQEMPPVSSKPGDMVSVSKRRRTSHGRSTDTTLDQENLAHALKQYTLVLELVEENKAENHPELLGSLFQIVSDLQHLWDYAQIATDYIQVLAIDSMLAIVNSIADQSDPSIDNSIIRTDVLVACINTTTSQQVRNSALLLVSALATFTPDSVLHSVMPVFTFMGANILRHNDDFSAHVVHQTMESIIPCLLHSPRKRRKEKDSQIHRVTELLLSFAAAFEHIHNQRRLDLFVSLIDKVGPGEYLFVFLAILLDKHAGDQGVLDFAVELVSHYDGKTCLGTMERYLEVILDIRKPKRSLSTPFLFLDQAPNVGHTTANLLPLVSLVLGNETLTSTIVATLGRPSRDSDIIREYYAQIVEKIFLLSDETKSIPKLHLQCTALLQTCLGLLPSSEMIDMLKGLLDRTPDNVRQQLLESFSMRLSATKTYQKSIVEASLAFLPQLMNVIEETKIGPLKQSAIACVDRTIEKFGKKNINAIVSAGRTVAGKSGLGATEATIQVASLICLATVVEVGGESSVPLIPSALSKAMDILTLSIEDDNEDASLHNAIYTFLSAVLLYVPWVITGTDLDRFLILSYESANAELGEEYDERRIETQRLVSKQVEARHCFAALKRTWTNAMTEGPLAVKGYIGILHSAIDRHTKSTIVMESEGLGDLFIRMFDLRRIQLSPPTEDSYTLNEIEDVEETINECAIAMIYKLNDATFRPLFARMSEWAGGKKDQKPDTHKQVTWYMFLLKFFDTLKSIVTSYAGQIIEQAVDIINNQSLDREDSAKLWRCVVRTLQSTFEHDQDDFYQSPSRFERVSGALLPQLAKASVIAPLPELIPAIVQLAIATDSAAHHKEMNTAILQYMRSESAPVRLAAVQCEKVLTEKLGEEWLALLPEMLPFISEALEDDDEDVEREVQRWIVAIEGILGESLDPMLQ